MKHTPEPWEVWNHDGDWTIEARSIISGFMVDIANLSFSEQDARRIVACVNACAGISNEVLEAPDYSVKAEFDSLDAQIQGRVKAETQRDELLAVLKLFADLEKKTGEVWINPKLCNDAFVSASSNAWATLHDVIDKIEAGNEARGPGGDRGLVQARSY